MPIRLRLALAFALAAAALFALGGWLFASGLSSAQLKTIDSQLTAQLAQAGRSLPAGDFLTQVIDPAGRVRSASTDAGNVALVTASQLSQARQGRIFVTRTVDEESTRIAAAPLAGRPGWVVVAAESLEAYEATQSQVARELAVGGAVFTAVAGLGAYWLARAALSPVERLRLARQRAYVADASHELRTPLAVLRGELELAARPGRGLPELAAAVRNSGAEAERLARLTDDLLLLARSDEDRLSLRLQRTDVGSLLARSAGLAGSRLAAAGLTCRVDVPPGTCADVDPDRIRQAVDNLIDNALRFAPRGSVIVLAARAADGGLDIEVSDDGPGFPAGFLPHAFERFARPDSGRSRGDGGAGLGLAIVRVIAAAHGGVATAGNKPGGGAVVRLRLPSAVGPP